MVWATIICLPKCELSYGTCMLYSKKTCEPEQTAGMSLYSIEMCTVVIADDLTCYGASMHDQENFLIINSYLALLLIFPTFKHAWTLLWRDFS